MTRLVKVALIVATATVAIAAIQLLQPSSSHSGAQATLGPSISPEQFMRTGGPLPETKVDSYH
jgi:hypothetical protein